MPSTTNNIHNNAAAAAETTKQMTSTAKMLIKRLQCTTCGQQYLILGKIQAKLEKKPANLHCVSMLVQDHLETRLPTTNSSMPPVLF